MDIVCNEQIITFFKCWQEQKQNKLNHNITDLQAINT